MENDVRDYQQLKDFYEEAKKKKIREGINNPLLFMAVVSGEILSVENEIEKSNKKKYEKTIYNTCENEIIYPHTYNQGKVDKNVLGQDLIYGSITEYSVRKRRIREYTIYELKELLRHCSVYGKNSFQLRFRGFGDIETQKVIDAINFYNEQIERQSFYFNPILNNEENIFYLHQDIKRELVEEQLKEIVEYLTDTAQICIWGEMTDCERRRLADLIYKDTRVNDEKKQQYINALSNYVTIDEAHKGLVKTKAIDRFIIK